MDRGAWWTTVHEVASIGRNLATVPLRTYCTAQATLLSALWRPKWEGNRNKRGDLCIHMPGESQGQGSLVGCCLWGRTELDMTEAT